MVGKIYALIWALGIGIVGLTYLTGNFTPTMNILFGFISFGLIFMGMIAVLPMTQVHHEPKKH